MKDNRSKRSKDQTSNSSRGHKRKTRMAGPPRKNLETILKGQRNELGRRHFMKKKKRKRRKRCRKTNENEGRKRHQVEDGGTRTKEETREKW